MGSHQKLNCKGEKEKHESKIGKVTKYGPLKIWMPRWSEKMHHVSHLLLLLLSWNSTWLSCLVYIGNTTARKNIGVCWRNSYQGMNRFFRSALQPISVIPIGSSNWQAHFTLILSSLFREPKSLRNKSKASSHNQLNFWGTVILLCGIRTEHCSPFPFSQERKFGSNYASPITEVFRASCVKLKELWAKPVVVTRIWHPEKGTIPKGHALPLFKAFGL